MGQKIDHNIILSAFLIAERIAGRRDDVRLMQFHSKVIACMINAGERPDIAVLASKDILDALNELITQFPKEE